MLLAHPSIAALRMSRVLGQGRRLPPRGQDRVPSEAMAAIMGYDRQAARQRTARKLHSAGLDAFILPADSDIDKIVRYERSTKRNLYRALYTLERMRALRGRPDASDSTSSPFGLNDQQF